MATPSGARPSPRRIFISYSRADGSFAAHELCRTLRADGHEVWLDTERIPGGSLWDKEIEDAISACDVLIPVLTRASVESEICRKELMYAFDAGKRIIPALVARGLRLPLLLKGVEHRKYPEQEARLLSDVRSESPPIPFIDRPLLYDTVPSLPDGYVARDEAMSALREMVLLGGEETSVGVTALAGMGGIGKTVLAAALCRDLAVQRAFPDGIAWITLGRDWDGHFMTHMREVGRALGEDVNKHWDSQQACENRYRTVLLKKSVLVVVDDVWRVDQLKPMLVDSRRSRVLFTTRNAGIAEALTTRSFRADLLDEAESLELLSRTASVKTTAVPQEAADIVRECRGLALAVAQIGGSLRGKPKAEWAYILEALRRADIGEIADRLPEGQQSFFESLAVSVQALPSDKRDRFLKLAVMLEDSAAPIEILETLWQLNEHKARNTARYLVDRSLASWVNAQDPTRGIKLHDLQLDYIRALYADQKALGLIHEAAKLSFPVIDQDPKQFCSQMLGRLLIYGQIPSIRDFIAGISEGAPRPWLRPMWPSLAPLGNGSTSECTGHTAGVVGVTLTRDGKRVLSASLDATVKVWDRKTGKELLTLRGHKLAVYSVGVSADSLRAVSASLDKTLKVWDLASGSLLRTIEGAHSRGVICIVLSPNGRKAISASWDKTVKLWDVEAGVCVRTFKGHSKCLNSVAVSEDWKIAVSGSEDKTLKVWDVETGSVLRTLKGHKGDVWAVAITPDGGLAVSASEDMTIKVWNLKTKRKPRTLRGHESSVYGVAVSDDGQLVISASDDMTLKIWDLHKAGVSRTLEGHALTVSGVALSKDSRFAVSSCYDASLKLWNLGTGREIRTLEGHSDGLNAVAATSDGRLALFASEDKTLKLWDLENGGFVKLLEGHSRPVWDVRLRGDGLLAVSVSGDETLRVWNLETGKEIQRLAHDGWINGVSVSADFRLAISACDDNLLRVWNLDTGTNIKTLRGHRDQVNAVALSADGRVAVSASYDYTLRVWHVADGRVIHVLRGHRDSVGCVLLTPDGRLAISGSDDGVIKIWNLKTGQDIWGVEGHSDSLSRLAISADQNYFASASWDKTLKIWNLESRSLVTTFTCDAPALCCAFVGLDKVILGDHLGRAHLLSLRLG